MTIRTLGLSAMLIGLLASASANAAPLLPGDSYFPAPSAADTGGTLIDQNNTFFEIPDSLGGQLFVDVVRDDPDNPYGGLTFIYRLANTLVGGAQIGDHSIGRFSLSGFEDFQTDVSYETPTTSIAPATIDRQEDGTSIGWSFYPNGVDANSGFLAFDTESARLVVHTDADDYAFRSGWVIDGGTTKVRIYGPVVPEPSTLLLSALGACGLIVARRLRG